ncbi:MAG: hypothetical protein R3C05_11910 [Pirellulaceae bacterium]
MTNRIFRYLEVMVIATVAGLLACIYVFMFFRMIRANGEPIDVKREQNHPACHVGVRHCARLDAREMVRSMGCLLNCGNAGSRFA